MVAIEVATVIDEATKTAAGCIGRSRIVKLFFFSAYTVNKHTCVTNTQLPFRTVAKRENFAIRGQGEGVLVAAENLRTHVQWRKHNVKRESLLPTKTSVQTQDFHPVPTPPPPFHEALGENCYPVGYRDGNTHVTLFLFRWICFQRMGQHARENTVETICHEVTPGFGRADPGDSRDIGPTNRIGQ